MGKITNKYVDFFLTNIWKRLKITLSQEFILKNLILLFNSKKFEEIIDYF